MIKTELIFSDNDAISFFRKNGLKVELKTIEWQFNDPYGHPYNDQITVWMVTNPHTNRPVLLKDMFEKFLSMKKKSLFLEDVNKLDLYNLFDK